MGTGPTVFPPRTLIKQLICPGQDIGYKVGMGDTSSSKCLRGDGRGERRPAGTIEAAPSARRVTSWPPTEGPRLRWVAATVVDRTVGGGALGPPPPLDVARHAGVPRAVPLWPKGIDARGRLC
ncbi:MAG: hypothetical protein AMXMBFR64_60600 [Myxococcales bacterium]